MRYEVTTTSKIRQTVSPDFSLEVGEKIAGDPFTVNLALRLVDGKTGFAGGRKAV